MADTVRIGIIGAGNFTRSRILPNLQKIEDVQVAAVANRSLESAQRIAEEFNIPEPIDDWREILIRDDIDAVFVGTQPYFHHQAVMNALERGKHVLCQTRMATSLRDAREMSRKQQETGRKAMLVRSAAYTHAHRYVKHLLDTGHLGTVRQVFAYYFVPNYVEGSAPLHRRQDSRNYGAINPMALGIYWDVLRPWFGDPRRMLAHSSIFTPLRPEGRGGPNVTIDMPDSITVIAEMESGPIITLIQTGVAHFGYERIEIYGEEGTLVYPVQGDLLGARKGDAALVPLEVPADMADDWHVEADFVGLIRGEIKDAHPNFAEGVKNIEFLEAAHRSAQEGRWVDLPLL
jgi:predicted dehydrogenase